MTSARFFPAKRKPSFVISVKVYHVISYIAVCGVLSVLKEYLVISYFAVLEGKIHH